MPRKRVKPGHIILKKLSEGPASIGDIHRAYIDEVKDDNEQRPKKDRARWMTYHSMVCLVRWAKLAGLVEPVEEVPLRGTNLLGIRGKKVVQARMIKYGLTSEGFSAGSHVWDDLSKHYRLMIQEG